MLFRSELLTAIVSNCVIRSFAVVLLALTTAGCGGGSSGSSDSSSQPAAESGYLAQNYVKNATIIADKIIADGKGNYELDAEEVGTVSDDSGYYTLSIPADYGDYVLYAFGGTVLAADGETESAAHPMLAPAGSRNLTPVSTLCALNPDLADMIGDDFDVDIADSNGIDGSILQLAQSVETLLEILTAEGSQIVSSNKKTACMEHLADALAASLDLSSDVAITAAATAAVTNILNDSDIIDSDRITIDDAAGIISLVTTGVQTVLTAIDETATVVESDILETVETAVSNAAAQISDNISGYIAINSKSIHYRTYSNADSNRYKGWLGLSQGFDTVAEAAVSSVALKNDSGSAIDISTYFYSASSYSGYWNSLTDGPDYMELVPASGYSISFASGTEIPAGDYTFEVTPTEGEKVSSTFSIPELREAPIVQSDTMTAEKQSDSGYTFSWSNPDGNYDQLVILFYDQDGDDVFSIYLPTDIEEFTIPGTWMQTIRSRFQPQTLDWQIQTRTVTDAGINDARGYSESVEFYQNVASLAFTLENSPAASRDDSDEPNELIYVDLNDSEPVFSRKTIGRGRNALNLNRNGVYLFGLLHNPNLSDNGSSGDNSSPISTCGNISISSVGLDTLPISHDAEDEVDLGTLNRTTGSFASGVAEEAIAGKLGYSNTILKRFGLFDQTIMKLLNPDINQNGIHDREEDLDWRFVAIYTFDLQNDVFDFENDLISISPAALRPDGISYYLQIWSGLDNPPDYSNVSMVIDSSDLQSSAEIQADWSNYFDYLDVEYYFNVTAIDSNEPPFDGDYTIKLGATDRLYFNNMYFLKPANNFENYLLRSYKLNTDSDGNLSSIQWKWKVIRDGAYADPLSAVINLRAKQISINFSLTNGLEHTIYQDRGNSTLHYYIVDNNNNREFVYTGEIEGTELYKNGTIDISSLDIALADLDTFKMDYTDLAGNIHQMNFEY